MSINLLAPYDHTKSAKGLAHILVIDDDKFASLLFSTALDKTLYEATFVTNSDKAFAILQSQKVDVILLDLVMPKISGFEVLLQLKASNRWHHIPVIVISSLNNTNEIAQCIRMGAIDYLTKPINPTILQARLAATLSDKRLNEIIQTTHKAMRDSEIKLRSILETAVDVIVMINEQGLIESVNPAIEQLFGYSAEELTGKNISILMPSPLQEKHDGYIARYMQTGEKKVIGIGREVLGQRQDGTVFPLSLAINETWIRGQRFFTGILRDLSKQKQAEEAYMILVNRSVQGLAIVQDGVYVFVNPAYAQIFGYPQEEIVGMSPIEFGQRVFYREDWSLILQKYQDRTAGKTIHPYEIRIIRPDGTMRWIKIEGLIVNYKGKPATQSMILDITEQKKTKEVLMASLNRKHILYDVAHTLMMYKNLPDLLQKVADRIAAALPADRVWIHIFDLEKEKVKHFLIGGTRKKKHDGNIKLSFHKLMEGLIGWVIRHEKTVRTTKDTIDERVSEQVRQDRIQWDIGSLIVSPLQHQQRTIGTLTVIHSRDEIDLTVTDVELIEALGNQISMAIENIELYELDKQQKYELQQRNEELDAFSRMVAHDLKNPIITINAFVYLLLESDLSSNPETSRRRIKQIASSTNHMLRITDDLLLLARIRSEMVTLEPIQMSNVLVNVQERLHIMIKECQPEIVWADEWYKVWGYAGWLEEVWINYISNALKYGGSPPYVSIGATCQANKVCYWVKDNGQGIEPDHQVDLFKPFTRFHDGQIEGHGLGLSIIQRIIEKLGGEVGVESEAGQGSRFWFTLSLYCE